MIVLNGTVHEGRGALFDLGDRGLTLGDGLFETMTVFGGTVYRLGDHLDRMSSGLAVLGFEVPRERIAGDIAALAAHAPRSGAVLRITATRGVGARGLLPPETPAPTLFGALAPYDPAIMGVPVRLAVSPIRRNEHSPLSRLKSLNYLDSVLALAQARKAGADDALLLNTAGRAASAAAANIFRVVGDRLETPPVSEAVLGGIIRGRVLELAASAGLRATERPLSVSDLAEADAVFLTNSVRLVQPVTGIDGDSLPTGSPAVEALMTALLAEVMSETGTDPRG
jgi:branched-chain amino acid aminotransferase